MKPAVAREMLDRFLAKDGEDVVVRRYVGAGEDRPFSDTVARARVTGYAPVDIVGNVQAGDRHVIMSIAALGALLPLEQDGNDVLLVGGREQQIKYVDDRKRRINGELIGLELQVRGP